MKKLISVICPVFNEEVAIPLFYAELQKAIAPLRDRYDFELLFTNNRSSDGSLAAIEKLHAADPTVQAITYSRNFGYQGSLLGGLAHAQGDAIVIIDVDCEDPPAMIPRFVEQWEKGFDMVYGRRDSRPESAIMQATRKLFYRLTKSIADYDFVLYMAEFSLFTRRVKDEILKHRSTYPFIRADLGYIGFDRIGISYERHKRIAGETHYNLVRMFEFALAGILSSSTFPLRLASYIGFPLAFLNVIAACVLPFFDSLRANLFGPLLLLDIAFIVQAVTFTAMYVARVYKDGVGRPRYIIDWQKSVGISRPRPAS